MDVSGRVDIELGLLRVALEGGLEGGQEKSMLGRFRPWTRWIKSRKWDRS